MNRQYAIDLYDAMSRIDSDLIAEAERDTGYVDYAEQKNTGKNVRHPMSAAAVAACIAGFAVVLYLAILTLGPGGSAISAWFRHESGTGTEPVSAPVTQEDTQPETETDRLLPADGVFTAYICDAVETFNSVMRRPGVLRDEDVKRIYPTDKQEGKGTRAADVFVPIRNETVFVRYTSVLRNLADGQAVASGKGDKGTYEFDVDTGIAHRWSGEFDITSHGEPLSDEALRAAAEEICGELSAYFGVSGGLVLQNPDDTLIEISGITYRQYTFVRRVNDLTAPERILVSLLPDGTLCGFNVMMPNVFAGIRLPEDYLEQCRAAVERRLSDMFASAPDGLRLVSVQCKTEPVVPGKTTGVTLCRMPDGGLGIVMDAVISVTEADGTPVNNGKEGAKFVIPIS